jgi:hypothetical protein
MTHEVEIGSCGGIWAVVGLRQSASQDCLPVVSDM